MKDAESTTDHSYMTALFCLLFAPDNLDKDKLLKMTIIHDLGEVETKDMITEEGAKVIPDLNKKKVEAEKAKVKEIFSQIENGDEFFALWEEAEAQKTPEAKFLKQLDKFEPALQSYLYWLKNGKPKDMQYLEWIENASAYAKDEMFKELLDKLRKLLP